MEWFGNMKDYYLIIIKYLKIVITNTTTLKYANTTGKAVVN